MSETKNYLTYLSDIIQHIAKAESFVREMTFKEFTKDEKTIFAVVRALEVIGEAVKHIPSDIRAKYPQIPWRDIAGMRDVLIHDYIEVDIETVWKTVKENIPKVKPLFKEVLKNLKEKKSNT